MAEWTRENVIDFAPEFAAVDPAILDRFIAYAEPGVNPAVFGDETKRAGSLYTAHLLTLAQPAGTAAGAASGVVQSETIGSVSVTYAVPQSGTSSALSLTKYGAEFSRLARLRACGPWVL